MSAPPQVTVILLEDQDRYYVSVIIGQDEYELGRYEDTKAAATRMNDWVVGHGYEWATDTARLVDEAQRRDAKCLVLHAVPESTESKERRMAWVPYASDYIWQL